jgi:hypothetical protein
MRAGMREADDLLVPGARRDCGLFGPSSVTWHLHADPAMWIGGVRALFLQALHPLAVSGLMQNSTFARDPAARLLRTGEFIVATTWGTRAQAERAGARVRGVHRRMRITDPRTGRAVRLDQPGRHRGPGGHSRAAGGAHDGLRDSVHEAQQLSRPVPGRSGQPPRAALRARTKAPAK